MKIHHKNSWGKKQQNSLKKLKYDELEITILIVIIKKKAEAANK